MGLSTVFDKVTKLTNIKTSLRCFIQHTSTFHFLKKVVFNRIVNTHFNIEKTTMDKCVNKLKESFLPYMICFNLTSFLRGSFRNIYITWILPICEQSMLYIEERS